LARSALACERLPAQFEEVGNILISKQSLLDLRQSRCLPTVMGEKSLSWRGERPTAWRARPTPLKD